MVMIGIDDEDLLKELDERLQALFQLLIQSKKVAETDQHATGRFLDWLIYTDWETHTEEVDIRPIQWSDGLAPPLRDMLIEVARAAPTWSRAARTATRPASCGAARTSCVPAASPSEFRPTAKSNALTARRMHATSSSIRKCARARRQSKC